MQGGLQETEGAFYRARPFFLHTAAFSLRKASKQAAKDVGRQASKQASE